MAVSKEVKDILDKARDAQNYRKSVDAAMAALKKQNDEQAAQIASLQSDAQKIPTDRPLSDEDKAALVEALGDLNDAISEQSSTMDELKSDIHENIGSGSNGGSGGNAPAPAGHAPDAVAPAAGEPIHTDEQLSANGPANAPAGGLAPLMPNMAFNPAPTGVGVADAGQPSQVPAMETSGGFVVAGGGTTQRAPGSMPDSPSSSQVVPADPDAKAPASSADVAKTGLGDSSANALTDAQGRQVLRDDVSGQVAIPPSGSVPPTATPPVAQDDPAVQQAQADRLADQQRLEREAADKAAADKAAADKAAADQRAKDDAAAQLAAQGSQSANPAPSTDDAAAAQAKRDQDAQAAAERQPVENPS